MTHDEDAMITPREYDYWKLIYSELVLLPDWSELSAESRAHKLLERVDEKLLEADAPPTTQSSLHMPTRRKAEDCEKDDQLFENEENN